MIISKSFFKVNPLRFDWIFFSLINPFVYLEIICQGPEGNTGPTIPAQCPGAPLPLPMAQDPVAAPGGCNAAVGPISRPRSPATGPAGLGGWDGPVWGPPWLLAPRESWPLLYPDSIPEKISPKVPARVQGVSGQWFYPYGLVLEVL